MYATYTLTKDELNYEFLDNLKKLVNGNQIHLSIESYDETEYLMRSPKNRDILLERIKYVEDGGELIRLTNDELKSLL